MRRFWRRSTPRAVMLIFPLVLAFVQSPALAVTAETPCPVTPYRAEAPSGPGTMTARADGTSVSYTETWYGNDALWAGISRGDAGRWYADTDGFKVLWVREAPGALTIHGRRLDAESPPLTARIPSGYGDEGIQATALLFPDGGCWEVAGRVAGAELRFVVFVYPAAEHPRRNGGQPAPPGPDVWASLRRPLQISDLQPGAACPAATNNGAWSSYHTAGTGPVYAAGAAGDGLLAYNLGDAVDGRGVAKGSWAASPDYRGPILIRGRQIDGPESLMFAAGAAERLTDELHLSGDGELAEDGWRAWGLRTFLRAPGCYAVQVDGWNFSEIIVLEGRGPDGRRSSLASDTNRC